MHIRDQIRDDDTGEMLLLMAGLTAMLLGVAGLLLWTLGQPLASTSTEINQDASLAGALT